MKELRKPIQKRQAKHSNKATKHQSIKVYKLLNECTRIQYCKKLNHMIEKMNWQEINDLAALWQMFK